MHSLRATICAASVIALGLVAPLSAVADTGAAPAGDPSSIAASKNGSAVVKLDACTVVGGNGRSASFSSKMEGGTNAAAIELRFELYTRPIAGGAWTLVPNVPKFGSWDRPSSGSVVWSKSVGGLTVGQSYRVLVTHLWLSKSGRVIRRVVLSSPVCDQSDARPDLSTKLVSSKLLANGNRLYTLMIRNGGFTAAAGFSVSLRIGELELPTYRVASLGAGKSRIVTFTAAGCASGSKIRAEADFSKEVAEPNEANNVIETACPSMGG